MIVYAKSMGVKIGSSKSYDTDNDEVLSFAEAKLFIREYA